MLDGLSPDAFPVLARTAYLNAGTCGPMPVAATDAIAAEAELAGRMGRGLPYYDRLTGLKGRARATWGRLLGASDEELALTAGTSDGIARALALVDWQPGDRVVTSDEEHPGILGPLGAVVRRHGIEVVVAPWDEVAGHVTPETKLVAISHVSWLRGRVADLAAIGAAGAPILVDGAQSTGAIAVDLAELRRHGVVAYASSGQKWTCGPVGTGALWVDPAWAPDGGIGVWPTYDNLADPASGLGATAWPDARRLDAPSLSCELLAGSVAALEVLEGVGFAAIHAHGVERAAGLAERLTAAGLEVAPRGASTLVSWRSSGADGEVAAAAEQGVGVRSFQGQPWIRASVGAWTPDDHLERLLAVFAPR